MNEISRLLKGAMEHTGRYTTLEIKQSTYVAGTTFVVYNNGREEGCYTEFSTLEEALGDLRDLAGLPKKPEETYETLCETVKDLDIQLTEAKDRLVEFMKETEEPSDDDCPF